MRVLKPEIPIGFAAMPTKKGFLDLNRTREIDDVGITDTRELLAAVNTDRYRVNMLPYYHVWSFD
jgi:hypothetical protein